MTQSLIVFSDNQRSLCDPQLQAFVYLNQRSVEKPRSGRLRANIEMKLPFLNDMPNEGFVRQGFDFSEVISLQRFC